MKRRAEKKNEMQNNEIKNIQEKMKRLEEEGMKAIVIEMKKEAEKEAEQKEKLRESEEMLRKQIDEEEKKAKCLKAAIEKKQLENQMTVETIAADKELAESQAKQREIIALMRAKFDESQKRIEEVRKAKEEEMKSRVRRKKAEVLKEIEDLQRINVSNVGKCFAGAEERKNDIRNYCTAFPADDLTRCTKVESFCDFCCEREANNDLAITLECKQNICSMASLSDSQKIGQFVWKANLK